MATNIRARVTIKVDGETLTPFPMDVTVSLTERLGFNYENLDGAPPNAEVIFSPLSPTKLLAFVPGNTVNFVVKNTNGDPGSSARTLNAGGVFLLANSAFVGTEPVIFTAADDNWSVQGMIGG